MLCHTTYYAEDVGDESRVQVHKLTSHDAFVSYVFHPSMPSRALFIHTIILS